VVHGDEKKATKTREVKIKTGETVAAVKLAVEYLGMAVRAVAKHPEYLVPAIIDEKLLLGTDSSITNSGGRAAQIDSFPD